MALVSCSQSNKPIKHNLFIGSSTSIGNLQHDSIGNYKQKVNDSLCKQRGHVFDMPINTLVRFTNNTAIGFQALFQNTTGSNKTSMGYGYNTDTAYSIIDDKDSSYILGHITSLYKYCYRCNKEIEFPKPDFYLKTIWKRNN